LNNVTKVWLWNPIYFQYSFFISFFLLIFFHNTQLQQDNIYVLYVLVTIFLGIGFYHKPIWFRVGFTTLIVLSRLFIENDHFHFTSFFFLEFTYLLIMFISSGLMKRNQKIKEDSLELILALSKALDSRDTYTSNHSQNAAWYGSEIAKKMKLPEHMIETVYKGGLLHDIGKIGIPENILLKPGPLTEEEYSIIKRHPIIGYNMIKHVSNFKDSGVFDIVLYHHERYDGKGYPKGLSGEDIPLVARIMAIADTFDAMTSKRVYRQEIDLENTLKEIKNNRGKQFDPELTDVFLSLFEDEKEKSHPIINDKQEDQDNKSLVS
jgi:HD-GYP domain-containing protein (c-di-GMP phosphodiesterase class II)